MVRKRIQVSTKRTNMVIIQIYTLNEGLVPKQASIASIIISKNYFTDASIVTNLHQGVDMRFHEERNGYPNPVEKSPEFDDVSNIS